MKKVLLPVIASVALVMSGCQPMTGDVAGMDGTVISNVSSNANLAGTGSDGVGGAQDSEISADENGSATGGNAEDEDGSSSEGAAEAGSDVGENGGSDNIEGNGISGSGDLTGTDSGDLANGTNPDDINAGGTTGSGTGAESGTGTNGSGTGAGSDAGATGNGTGTGSDAGTNGSGTGTGSDAGATGNGTGAESGTGATGNGTTGNTVSADAGNNTVSTGTGAGGSVVEIKGSSGAGTDVSDVTAGLDNSVLVGAYNKFCFKGFASGKYRFTIRSRVTGWGENMSLIVTSPWAQWNQNPAMGNNGPQYDLSGKPITGIFEGTMEVDIDVNNTYELSKYNHSDFVIVKIEKLR